MNTPDDRHTIILEFARGRSFSVWSHAQIPMVAPTPVNIEDGALATNEDSIPLETIFAINEIGSARSRVWLQDLPNAYREELQEVLAIAPNVQTALERLATGTLEEASEILESLPEPAQAALAEAAIACLEADAPSPLTHVFAHVLGRLARPEDTLRLGDLLMGHRVHEWQVPLALHALRARNSRDARMQVQRVALLGNRVTAIAEAQETLLRIAGDLKVPIWTVEDELVPDCGLDTEGQTSLGYGPRSFTLELDDALRPTLVSRPGRVRFYDLPDPEEDDDAELAKAARARWNVLREQLAEAIPVQARRFEESFVQQYRWTGEQWDAAIRTHPLLLHLVPRLVWGTYSKSGRKLLDTFRIARDRTLWGPDDEPYELDLSRTIGIAHPLELSEEIRDAWGEQLADYEIVTLFPQIDRPVYRPDPDWGREVTSVNLNIVVPEEHGLRELARHGWGDRQGWRHSIQKPFRARDVRAVLSPQSENGSLHLSHLQFERHLGYPQTTFQLRDVHKIVYSEAVYELETLSVPQDTGGWPSVTSSMR